MRKQGFPPGVHLRGGANAAITHVEDAKAFYAPIIPIVCELRDKGLSLRDIAAELDKQQVKMRNYGNESNWNASQVRRILHRAGVPTAPSKATPEPAAAPEPTRPAPIAPAVVTQPTAPLTPAPSPPAKDSRPASAPMPIEPATPVADITLLMHGRKVGPFSVAQIEQLLAAKGIDVETSYARPGVTGWRKVRELLKVA